MSITPSSALTQIESIASQSADLAGQLQQLAANTGTLAQAGLTYVPPIPPLDVFSWWVPSAGKAVKPVFVRNLPDGRSAAYFIKNAAGWPWDIQIADSVGVYFRVTENDAKDASGHALGWPPTGSPTSYRLYTQTNPAPSVSLGFMISPRYYDPSQGRIQVANVTDVPTNRYSSCTAFVQNHLGPAQSFISMQSVAFGADLGTQNSLICEYYYTVNTASPPTFKTRERFYLTEQSGWVWWDVASLQTNGTYAVTNTSYPNTFIPDNTLVPVFPCNIVL